MHRDKTTPPDIEDDPGVAPPDHSTKDQPRLDVVEIDGVGFDAGVAYGEACSDVILQHLESVLERGSLRKGVGEGELYRRSLPFRPFVFAESPDLGAEIDGIAKGAGIPTEAAWLLQLRAEVFRVDPVLAAECTSFGTTRAAASGTIAGQNADLPPFYQGVLVLLRRRTPDKPTVLTLTPAGQVGWHGMNDAGVAVFANFLYSDGWRPGVPRYLFTRIALGFMNARTAADHLIGMYRGSSRNVLLADEREVLDVELAVDHHGVIEADDGIVVHANHHVSDIRHLEMADQAYMKNSTARHSQMRRLVEDHGTEFGVEQAMMALRDRSGLPDSVCRSPDDTDAEDDTITVASTIADVANRRLWICIGPPHVGTYHEYAV